MKEPAFFAAVGIELTEHHSALGYTFKVQQCEDFVNGAIN
jgi:hypothetical protein